MYCKIYRISFTRSKWIQVESSSWAQDDLTDYKIIGITYLKGSCHFFNPLLLLIRWKALIETKIKQKNASKNIQPFFSYSGLKFPFLSNVTSYLTQFHTDVFLRTENCWKRRLHNFWNNSVGSTKFDISNTFGMRNPNIVLILEIENAFLNYSWMWMTQ